MFGLPFCRAYPEADEGKEKMSWDEREERMEASDRASRYYEIQGIDEPPHDSEEWRELVAIKLEQIREGK
jgi:hypothetical protein